MRANALESASILEELLADRDIDDRRLINGYLETKRRLARAFEAFAIERYGDPELFDNVKRIVEHAMNANYPQVPDRYRRVLGFGRVHEIIFAYLSDRVGAEVSADELRMLTGDAVHTERRARDLRSLGFELNTEKQGGIQIYILQDSVPNVTIGASQLLVKNIRNDKSLDSSETSRLLSMAGLD